MAGDSGLSCDLEGHDFSKELIICTVFKWPWWDFVAITVLEDHDLFSALAGYYRKMDHLTGRDFPTCLSFSDMGNMGSGTRNFKWFWSRNCIRMFLFCWVEFLIFLKEMPLGSVDAFWEMLGYEGCCWPWTRGIKTGINFLDPIW